jgi:hypothetical protein
MTNVLDDFADLKQFAQQVNRCERTVRRWCDEHRGLPHTRMGNRIFISIPHALAARADEERPGAGGKARSA